MFMEEEVWWSTELLSICIKMHTIPVLVISWTHDEQGRATTRCKWGQNHLSRTNKHY